MILLFCWKKPRVYRRVSQAGARRRWLVIQYLEWADEALQAGALEEALADLVRAADAAKAIGTAEADAVRLAIAELMRAATLEVSP